VNQVYDIDVEDDVGGLSDNEWISDEYMSDVVDSDEEGYGILGLLQCPRQWLITNGMWGPISLKRRNF